MTDKRKLGWGGARGRKGGGGRAETWQKKGQELGEKGSVTGKREMELGEKRNGKWEKKAATSGYFPFPPK